MFYNKIMSSDIKGYLSLLTSHLLPLKNRAKRNLNIIIMAKVIEGLYYSESHEYVKVDGDFGFIGITDYAQNALGNVVYVDMPPVSGTVVEINEALEDQPELVNEDAYANWIIKVELSDKGDLDNLMDAAAYEEFCNK